MATKKWTAERDARLSRLYMEGRDKWHIAEILGTTSSAVRNRIHTLQLKRNFFRRPWSEDDDVLLKKLYPSMRAVDLVKRLNRSQSAIFGRAKKLGVAADPERVHRQNVALGVGLKEAGKAHRFPKGNVPANAGLRRPGYSVGRGRMQSTQFKKGQVSRNWLPVGTVRADSDGYMRIKIAEGLGGSGNQKIWAFVHKLVWEQAKGPVPKGHCLWFKDRNKSNANLENLELITRKENRRRNSIHNLPKELKDTIMLKGALNRRIRRIEREQSQHKGITQASV
ncbi:MAG: hypothetical protein NVS9B14_21500 [Candidatus Acidiferrum sp.]